VGFTGGAAASELWAQEVGLCFGSLVRGKGFVTKGLKLWILGVRVCDPKVNGFDVRALCGLSE
jgi:hypothetical protein